MKERGSDAETDMGDACFFSRPWHREFFCAEWAPLQYTPPASERLTDTHV